MRELPLHIVAVTAVIIRDGKCLILQRSEAETAFPGQWTVPGGKVEIGEGAAAALKREIVEETGLLPVGEPIYLGDFEFTRPDGIHVVGLRYRCAAEGTVRISPDFTAFAWVTSDELDGHSLIAEVKAMLARVLAEIKKS